MLCRCRSLSHASKRCMFAAHSPCLRYVTAVPLCGIVDIYLVSLWFCLHNVVQSVLCVLLHASPAILCHTATVLSLHVPLSLFKQECSGPTDCALAWIVQAVFT